MKKFEICVEKVTGYCACGYKEGDIFICEGLNTPNQAFCGGAYAILFPMQTALHSNATFDFEENPYCQRRSNLCSPVIRKLKILQECCRSMAMLLIVAPFKSI